VETILTFELLQIKSFGRGQSSDQYLLIKDRCKHFNMWFVLKPNSALTSLHVSYFAASSISITFIMQNSMQ